MALVFDNISNEPQTHIFIIGIGGYPYLKDGATPAPLPNDLKNLGQLTSPPVSAEALYNTAIELHNNNSWITPLGSIEVLVSPSPGGIPVFTGFNNIEPATHANIDKSYAAWKTRCDSSVDNIAIFYFCGHGLGKGLDQFLLVEDFGKNANSPWADAISFDDSRIAFYSCKAKTQLFFVDACREVTNTLLLYNVKGAQLETPPYVTTDCKYYLNMKAAATNEKAYGKRNEPS